MVRVLVLGLGKGFLLLGRGVSMRGIDGCCGVWENVFSRETRMRIPGWQEGDGGGDAIDAFVRHEPLRQKRSFDD
ncbi:hypothetical protein X751_26780 [Mesorhizobium sp. LNJC395A00]|nr:hypothetical protein X751_26780 [Mesorhizobium sp. LNJC395A00]